MAASNRLVIFDTTLRDGEQAPGFSLRVDEKLRMARQLEALGVDVRHVFALCFALGAMLTAAGASVVGLGFSVDPASGLLWLLRAVAVVVIGGMGSVWGTLAAAVLLGLVEELGAAWVGPEYRDVIMFALLVLILVLRPAGLFGKALR